MSFEQFYGKRIQSISFHEDDGMSVKVSDEFGVTYEFNADVTRKPAIPAVLLVGSLVEYVRKFVVSIDFPNSNMVTINVGPELIPLTLYGTDDHNPGYATQPVVVKYFCEKTCEVMYVRGEE